MSLAKYMTQQVIGYEPPNATVLETVTLPAIASEFSRGITFDPSGNLILVTVSSSGSYVGRIRTYDGFSATQIGSFIQFPGNPRYLEHVRFDESGDLIAINTGFNTYNPGVLAKYDGKSNTELSSFNTANRAIGAMEVIDGDVVWADQSGNVRRHDGFSSTILETWTTFSGGIPVA
ncbi:hypothetical protein ACFQDZ_00765 [Sulfitobacter pacificus]|uniref:hypothetical protein n=1 Tax=Sulfitobacter pacificus TaxID=1499314 RepID=UPI0036184999